jgi:Protein of unknown function (DUF1573)
MKLKVVFVAVCLFIATGAVLAAGKSSAPQSDGKPELSVEAMEHSFGNVKPGIPLTYSFVIKNKGKTDLEIKNVAPSCGCTTSSFDKVIAPGAEGKITLAVEKTDAYKGEVTKTATVSTNDPAHASFQLTLKATFVAE